MNIFLTEHISVTTSRNYIIVSTVKPRQAAPLQQVGTFNIAKKKKKKKLKRGDPKHFTLIRVELRSLFMVSWEARRGGNIFSCTPSARHENKGTPRL